MENIQRLLMDSARTLFAPACEQGVQDAVEQGTWLGDLWSAVEDNGLTTALLAEDEGGAGLDLASACSVLRVAGAFALPLPLAETMLAAKILAEAGLEVPAGPMTLAPSGVGAFNSRVDDGSLVLSGKAYSVPWLERAQTIVLVADDVVARVEARRLDLASTQFRDAAGLPCSDIDLSHLQGGHLIVAAHDWSDLTAAAEQALHVGALMRVSMIAGALDRVLDLCIEHATGRVQFGRPIAQFQAVQNLVAVLAGETAAISVSAPAAVRAWQDHGDRLAVAAAKTRAGEAAGTAARIAHQVHAAIGYTYEHILHRFTRRLWAWRNDFGSEDFWAHRVGQIAIASGSAGLWPKLSDR